MILTSCLTTTFKNESVRPSHNRRWLGIFAIGGREPTLALAGLAKLAGPAAGSIHDRILVRHADDVAPVIAGGDKVRLAADHGDFGWCSVGGFSTASKPLEQDLIASACPAKTLQDQLVAAYRKGTVQIW